MIILSLSFFLILTAVFALQISEHQLYDLVGGKNFLDFLFEVVSAFGTVGLSTGITGGMSDIGKFIIGVCMFTGGIGPLTLGIALQLRSKRKLHLEYPQEEILVG